MRRQDFSKTPLSGAAVRLLTIEAPGAKRTSVNGAPSIQIYEATP